MLSWQRSVVPFYVIYNIHQVYIFNFSFQLSCVVGSLSLLIRAFLLSIERGKFQYFPDLFYFIYKTTKISG